MWPVPHSLSCQFSRVRLALGRSRAKDDLSEGAVPQPAFQFEQYYKLKWGFIDKSVNYLSWDEKALWDMGCSGPWQVAGTTSTRDDAISEHRGHSNTRACRLSANSPQPILAPDSYHRVCWGDRVCYPTLQAHCFLSTPTRRRNLTMNQCLSQAKQTASIRLSRWTAKSREAFYGPGRHLPAWCHHYYQRNLGYNPTLIFTQIKQLHDLLGLIAAKLSMEIYIVDFSRVFETQKCHLGRAHTSKRLWI